MVKNNQDNDFYDNKLKNLDSVNSVIGSRITIYDNELTSEMYVDNQLNIKTIVRFNQSVQNFLKVSIGNATYKLTKCNLKN